METSQVDKTEVAVPTPAGSNNDKPSLELNENDVVCEKGRGDHERWPGNKLYRYLVKINKESYNDLTPMERSEIIGKIISTVREKKGWFVQLDEESGRWTHLCEEKVRKKVSDDLRREVRRKREKRSNNTVFSAKLRALKEMEDGEPQRDILKPVEDPRQTDVLFGAGARRHPGNKTYWRLMKLNLDHYIISPYGARSMISRSIVQGIRDQNGRFLEQDPKTAVWYEITDKRAIEKTSHALSNKKYKTRKRAPDSPGSQYSSPEKATKSFDCHEDDGVGGLLALTGAEAPIDESADQAKAKKRTKKFRLLQRMGDPEDEEESECSPRATASPVTDDSSDSKASTPDSPPSLKSVPPSKEETEEERVVVSPNDSRDSPSYTDPKAVYLEESVTRAFRRYHPRPPAVRESDIRSEYDRIPADGYRPHSRDPHYEAYISERYYYNPNSSRRVRGSRASFSHFAEAEWTPVTRGEPLGYIPRGRSLPVYGLISPRLRKEEWADIEEWGVPPRGHHDDPRSW